MYLHKSHYYSGLFLTYQILILVLVALYLSNGGSSTSVTSTSTSDSTHPFIFVDRSKSSRQGINKFHRTRINMASTTSEPLSNQNQNGSCSNNNEAPAGIAHLLARSNILELQPYRCARDDYSTGILLDANENSYGPPTSVKEQVQKQPQSSSLELERYPDPYQIPLKERLIEFRGYNNNENTDHQYTKQQITANNIFVGVGSDEAIDLLMRIFCIPQTDCIMTTPPTYGMYKVCAKVNDVSIVTVPLTPQFDVEIERIIDAITPNVKLLFLCSPGNPTSKLIPLADVRMIASHPKIANQVIVVVDEAYIDFAIPASTSSTRSNSSNDVSAVQLVPEYNNIVVLQTLSKAFGLAAIRCGFCIGPPDIIQLMNNVKAPYNVNTLTSQLAYEALDSTKTQASIMNHIDEILQQRSRVVTALQSMDFVSYIYPSDSNFILFRVAANAYEVYKYMADTANIVTRYRGTELHCDECIRVTIGTAAENDAFLSALPTAYAAVIDSKK